MIQWIRKGIRTGILTTVYPDGEETAAGVSPGLPIGGEYPENEMASMIAQCPTQALRQNGQCIEVDYRRCVHCHRCDRGSLTPLAWRRDYEWGVAIGDDDPDRQLDNAFRRSIHVLVIDAGDCGACLREVKQLNNPYYNMHRLGFFITPTPRHADILLVVGPVTDHMRPVLEKVYDAMPAPKRVMAVGACALSGGIFGQSFVSHGGVDKVIPVDIEVPGLPPPPLSILHGLLVAAGRKPSAAMTSPAPTTSAEGGK